MKNKCTLVCFLVIIPLFCHVNLLAKTQNSEARLPKPPMCLANKFAGMQGAPLSFIENVGQVTDQFGNARSDIHFQIKTGNGLSIFIGRGAVHYQFCNANHPSDSQPQKSNLEAPTPTTFSMYRMDVELIGANKHAKIVTRQAQKYRENYFTAAAGKDGATALSYERIVYKDIYPNIDWVLYISGGKLT